MSQSRYRLFFFLVTCFPRRTTLRLLMVPQGRSTRSLRLFIFLVKFKQPMLADLLCLSPTPLCWINTFEAPPLGRSNPPTAKTSCPPPFLRPLRDPRHTPAEGLQMGSVPHPRRVSKPPFVGFSRSFLATERYPLLHGHGGFDGRGLESCGSQFRISPLRIQIHSRLPS